MQIDFEKARANMVESQVRTSDVSDRKLIDAIAGTKREAFVAPAQIEFAYAEIDAKSISGRVLLKPRDFSKLAQALNISKNDEVLVIAGAGGYSAAVLALLAANVTVFDEIDCPVKTTDSVIGDLTSLSPLNDKAFDVIFVDQSVGNIPDGWFKVLKDGGRMAAIKSENGIGNATLFVKTGENIASRIIFYTSAPKTPLFVQEEEFQF